MLCLNSEISDCIWSKIPVEKILKNTLMKVGDTRFSLAATETCGKLKNTLMKFWDTGFCLAARKREENSKKNTFMKFRDTRFWLAARNRAENLKIL